jgi:hypothetical protein
VVSTALLRAVLRLLLKTAGNASHLMLGLSLLEGMVHRAVKRAGSKGSTGILVTDVEVRLFDVTSHHMTRNSLATATASKYAVPPILSSLLLR